MCSLHVNGEQTQQFESFSYVGSFGQTTKGATKKIIRRIPLAKTVFDSMSNVFVLNKRIKMETRIRVLTRTVWSVLLNGSEAWIIFKTMQMRLQAAEMWFLTSLRRISRTEKISAEQCSGWM